MRIAISGSSGLLGGALAAALRARGDDVVRLVRRSSRGPGEVFWDPSSGAVDTVALGDVDAVVNLAGAPIGKRWTPSYKRQIWQSRVQGTETLARTVAVLPSLPVLVNGSAVGFYGDRPGEELTETSVPGHGFLADVVQAWEAATAPAVRAGARVALIRTGLVMSSRGGALERMLPLVRWGLGGPLGSGRQVWPWVHLADEVRAIAHVLDTPHLGGPVNVAAPQSDSQADVVAALADALRRPSLVPAPAFALRLALGEFASDILASQHVVPQVLLDSGFEFRHGDVASMAARVASGTPGRPLLDPRVATTT